MSTFSLSPGDIIRYDTEYGPSYFGVVREFLHADIVAVEWYDPDAAEEIGEALSSWGFGDTYRKVG